ncbi:STAS domain-containing protein [Actinomycetospora lutea]|uniref:STAS domain-containing protein n=1 Tax=Actinomycetospora lutea TaxID=663604 RepID=UPI00236566F7|nr:STAS domain-containing protein [Actinomycetospora lutea]MDD7939561.1 STAS domain-containing protein [Actinomycetospora lutea]
MNDGDVLVVFQSDLDVAPHVHSCVEEVRAAGTRIVAEQAWPDGLPSTPCRLHLGGTLSFFTDAGAALLLASASDPCDSTFRLDLARLEFLGLRGCAALLRGTRRLREHGGHLRIEHPRVPVRRVLDRGLAGALNVSIE